MVRSLLAGFLILAVCTTSFTGCGARAEVAKDKILAKLDKVLGELDVKRKEIEIKQRELRKQLDDVRQRRIESKVRLENLMEKKKASETKLNGLKQKLAKVKALVDEAAASEDGTITREEKTYSKADIEKSGQKVIAAFKAEQTRIGGMEAGIKALQDSFNFLQTQETTAVELMDKLAVKIEAIDAKKIAVDAVKEATSISGDTQSMNDSLADLEKDIEELSIDLETALRVEESKLADLDSSNSAADELLRETTNLDSLSSEIDDILSGN